MKKRDFQGPLLRSIRMAKSRVQKYSRALKNLKSASKKRKWNYLQLKMSFLALKRKVRNKKKKKRKKEQNLEKNFLNKKPRLSLNREASLV